LVLRFLFDVGQLFGDREKFGAVLFADCGQPVFHLLGSFGGLLYQIEILNRLVCALTPASDEPL
jgi:hypothetical protein